MKFITSVLLFVSCVTAQVTNIQVPNTCAPSADVPNCAAFTAGTEAVWNVQSCMYECRTKCLDGSAFRNCQTSGCSTMRCIAGTTCRNDRCVSGSSTCSGKCVTDPVLPPIVKDNSLCLFGKTLINDLLKNTNFDFSSKVKITAANAGTLLDPAGQQQIYSGIDGFETLSAVFASVENGEIFRQNIIEKTSGTGYVLWSFSAGDTNAGWVNVGKSSYRVARISDDSIYECRAQKPVPTLNCVDCRVTNCGINAQCITNAACPSGTTGVCTLNTPAPTPAPCDDQCLFTTCAAPSNCVTKRNPLSQKCEAQCQPITCNIFQSPSVDCPSGYECIINECPSGQICIPERPGTCQLPKTKTCTDSCTAKCSAGSVCVFNKQCVPQCAASTAGSCPLNDGVGRIVAGGKYFNKCNGCECGSDGKPGICDKKGCIGDAFNNDGTPKSSSTCKRVCTQACKVGFSCQADAITGCVECRADPKPVCVDCRVTNCGINAQCIPNAACKTGTATGTCVVNPPPCDDQCLFTTCAAPSNCITARNPLTQQCEAQCQPIVDPTPAPQTCNIFKGQNCEAGFDCIIDPCPAGKICIPERPGVCQPQQVKTCTETCAAKCSAGQFCVFNKQCQPTCQSSTKDTCSLNDGNSRVVSGGMFYSKCNGCSCGIGGRPGICTEMFCVGDNYGNDGKAIAPPVKTCSQFIPPIVDCESGFDCIIDPCPAGMMCIPERRGTCQPAKAKTCTDRCAAKCTAGSVCVFNKQCQPTCASSAKDTCLMNDQVSRIVVGGSFYGQCNTCTCAGETSACTRKFCPAAEYNNDGTEVAAPTKKPTVSPPVTVLYSTFTLTWSVTGSPTQSSTRAVIATRMRDIATAAGVRSSLVLNNDDIVFVSGTKTQTWDVKLGFTGATASARSDAKAKFIAQLKKVSADDSMFDATKIKAVGADDEFALTTEPDETPEAEQTQALTACADGTMTADEQCSATQQEAFVIATPVSSSSSTPIAAIVGGAVGGVVLLTIIIAAVVLMQRRRAAAVTVTKMATTQGETAEMTQV